MIYLRKRGEFYMAKADQAYFGVREEMRPEREVGARL